MDIFFKNEQNEPVFMKTTEIFIANEKIGAVKKKNVSRKASKTHLLHHKLNIFPNYILSDEIRGNVINVMWFFLNDIISPLTARTMSQICIQQAQGSTPRRHTICTQ